MWGHFRLGRVCTAPRIFLSRTRLSGKRMRSCGGGLIPWEEPVSPETPARSWGGIHLPGVFALVLPPGFIHGKIETGSKTSTQVLSLSYSAALARGGQTVHQAVAAQPWPPSPFPRHVSAPRVRPLVIHLLSRYYSTVFNSTKHVSVSKSWCLRVGLAFTKLKVFILHT